MADKKNVVVTYVVSFGQQSNSLVNEDVQKAIDDGYRVIDVISTPGSAGGGSNPMVAVTVVLDNTADARYNWKR